MDVSALASSLSAQATMGMLVNKVLDQSAALIQQQAAANAAQSSVQIAGVGENLDVTA